MVSGGEAQVPHQFGLEHGESRVLECVDRNFETTALRKVEFSAVKVGEKFATDRWMWEKVDDEYAKALLELMGRSSALVGTMFHFESWSKVQLIDPAQSQFPNR